MWVMVRFGRPALRSLQETPVPSNALLVTCNRLSLVPTYTVFGSLFATPMAVMAKLAPEVRSGEIAAHLPAPSRVCQSRYVPKYRVCGLEGSIARGGMN